MGRSKLVEVKVEVELLRCSDSSTVDIGLVFFWEALETCTIVLACLVYTCIDILSSTGEKKGKDSKSMTSEGT